MKKFEFGEDQLTDLESIAKAMLEDENDPRSNSYIRKLNRPDINWLKIVLSLLLPPVLLSLLCLFYSYFQHDALGFIITSCSLLLIYYAINLKDGIICCVKIYQRYAPDSLRQRCRFEPSCSEYMILAIEKYGVFKGISMGLKRMKRCNVNGGGFDYP